MIMRSYQILALMLFCSFFQHVFAQDLQFEIAKYKDGKRCAISYTFDDGLKEHYSLAYPYLNKYGFKATFWINGYKVNGDAISDTTRITWSQLKEMSNHGHEISNHGLTHKNLVRIPFEDAKYEILKNDTVIFENIGHWPKTFCYPNNAKNPQIVEFASENRVATRLFQFSMGSKSSDENLENKINDLITKEEWGVAMLHGITYGYDRFSDPNILWRHLDKVYQLADKIWVATFVDVAQYINLRDNISLEINKKKNAYEIVPVCTLDKDLFNHSLTLNIQNPSQKTHKIKASQNKKPLSIQKNSDGTLFLNFNPFDGPILIH